MGPRLSCWRLLLLVALPVRWGGEGLDNGAGRRPALGWSSWNHFHAAINATILMQVADAMASNGLRDAGYEFINLDDGWAVNRTAQGVLVPDPALFPESSPGANDGIRIVADYIHAKRMKFGIYTARGSVTCLGRPGSDSHEVIDAKTWASWGVDYLKEDTCGGVMHGTTWQQYARMRDALNSTGRQIYFSVTEGVPFDDGPDRANMHCPYLPFTVKPWVLEGKNPQTLANAFLIEYCNNFDWWGFTGAFDPAAPLTPKPGGFLSQLDAQALLTFDNLTAAGSYSDMDIFQICNGGQTTAEYRSQFSSFAILTSPMILGNDVRSLTSECAGILMNTEVIAVNQDSNVVRGKLVYQWPDARWPPVRAKQGALISNGVVPPMIGAVRLERCDATEQRQQWTWSNKMLQTGIQSNRRCLTYSGQVLTNLGLADCSGWSQPGVGGQFWETAIGPPHPPGPPPPAPSGWHRYLQHCLSEKPCSAAHCNCASEDHIRSFTHCDGGTAGCVASGVTACENDSKCSGFGVSSYAGGSYETYTGLWDGSVVSNSDWTAYVRPNASSVGHEKEHAQPWQRVILAASPDKCLAVFDCNATAGQPLQLCECKGDGGCGINATSCPLAAGFELNASSGSSGLIRSALDPSLCLTTGPALPIPHGFMNITLQIWTKRLASGAVAALALNRGEVNTTARFDWKLLDLETSESYIVRDLWRKTEKLVGHGGFEAEVAPHDVVMVIVRNATEGVGAK